MILPRRLSDTTLGDLLGMLHRARITGTLELCSTGVPVTTHRIHLFSGLVEQVDSPLGAAPIGELLRQRGAVENRTLARLLLHGGIPGRHTGEALVAVQAVAPSLVARVLREQLQDRLEALFTLGDATIRFHVARRRGKPELRPLPLLPRDFLHSRPRKRARNPDSDRIKALRALGLEAGAGAAAIRSAFRRLAMQTHPDRHPGLTGEERAALVKRFAALSAAYHCLLR
jgi:hypothetical protein